MFTILTHTFNRYIEITNPIDDNLFTEENVRYFDNDGFQLSLLEQEYYKANKVTITNTLNRAGDRPPWMSCTHDKFYLDHSMMPQRWCYIGAAKEQLELHKNRFPSLIKYINLKPKWGLDFALEYYEADEPLEVLHIEFDFRNYYSALSMKQDLEKKINNTDWEDFKNQLIKRQHEWKKLQGLDQNDWKAQFWGLKKAEKTYKVI
ncbi:MAG: hypothetical protein EBU90_16195 [Proteobacteria bacterium]|nr:hypothetical protein [Pseudomonadota bacterium]